MVHGPEAKAPGGEEERRRNDGHAEAEPDPCRVVTAEDGHREATDHACEHRQGQVRQSGGATGPDRECKPGDKPAEGPAGHEQRDKDRIEEHSLDKPHDIEVGDDEHAEEEQGEAGEVDKGFLFGGDAAAATDDLDDDEEDAPAIEHG